MNILMLTNIDFVDYALDMLYVDLKTKGLDVHIHPFKDNLTAGHNSTPNMYNMEKQKVGYEDIKKLLREGFYDLIIAGCIMGDIFKDEYRELIQSSSCPVVVYQSHDYNSMYNAKEYVGKNLLLEFRKEVPIEQNDPGVLPLALPIFGESIPINDSEKKYDVCCIYGWKGDISEQKRKMAVEIVHKEFPNSIAIYHSATSTTPYNEYRNYYRQSWIGVNIQGIGKQTCRYFEIPQFGAGLVSEYLGINIPNDFQDGVHARYFHSFDEMIDIIHELLADKDQIIKMTIEAQRQLVEYFTSSYITDYFLKTVTNLM